MRLKSANKLSSLDITLRAIIIAVVFALTTVMAYKLPRAYAPDEYMRNAIAYFIFRHGKLPVGNEFELINNLYGFSYASLPFLPAIISAGIMKVASFFTQSEHLIFFASRMVSVISVTLIPYVSFLIGDKVFQKKSSTYLFAIISAFLPQVIFIGGYFNNDTLALLGAYLIMYFLILGKEKLWSTKTLIGLSVSLSFVLLSYYNAYGWVLVSIIFCVVSCLFDERIDNKFKFIFKKFSIVFLITVLLAGWFFIRNAILHNGDFLGRNTANIIAAEFEKSGHEIFKFNPPKAQGISVFSMLGDGVWLKTTIQSFIGKFGMLSINLPDFLYTCYYIFFGLGFVLAIIFAIFDRKKYFWHICLLIAGITPLVLTVIYSYSSDYQPQGRYAISLLPALAYFVTYGFEKLEFFTDKHILRKIKVPLTVVFCVLYIVLFSFSYFGTMRTNLYFSPSLNTDIQSDSSVMTVKYNCEDKYSSVRIAVWKDYDNDLVWTNLTKSISNDEFNSVNWTATVNLSKYNTNDFVNLHVYAVNYKGKDICLSENVVKIPKAVRENQIFVKDVNGQAQIYMEPIDLYDNVSFEIISKNAERQVITAKVDDNGNWVSDKNIKFSNIISVNALGDDNNYIGNKTAFIN